MWRALFSSITRALSGSSCFWADFGELSGRRENIMRRLVSSIPPVCQRAYQNIQNSEAFYLAVKMWQNINIICWWKKILLSTNFKKSIYLYFFVYLVCDILI
jgi:hypothetical protein